MNTNTLLTSKTLQLGTGLKTAGDFRGAIAGIRNNLEAWAKNILEYCNFTEECEVDLVIRSVAELGLQSDATGRQIYDRALELGLQLCPSEVGPQLRLQYQDQPKGEQLLIAMEPIAGSNANLAIFGARHDDSGLELYAIYGHPDRPWKAGDCWVFIQPRK